MHHKFPSDGSEYDLAGQFYTSPNYHQIQCRINCLVDSYIADKKLSDRLKDLPVQFENPQPRPWKPIDWRAVQADQMMKRVLNWPAWSLTNKTTFLLTFDQVMHRLWRWNTSQTPDYLNHLFGERRLSWK